MQPLVEGAVGGGAGGQQGGITHGAPRQRGCPGKQPQFPPKKRSRGNPRPDAASSTTAEDKDKDDEPRSLFGRAAHARACHAVTEAQARGPPLTHTVVLKEAGTNSSPAPRCAVSSSAAEDEDSRIVRARNLARSHAFSHVTSHALTHITPRAKRAVALCEANAAPRTPRRGQRQKTSRAPSSGAQHTPGRAGRATPSPIPLHLSLFV